MLFSVVMLNILKWESSWTDSFWSQVFISKNAVFGTSALTSLRAYSLVHSDSNKPSYRHT